MADGTDISEIFFFIVGGFNIAGQLEKMLKQLLSEPAKFIESFADMEWGKRSEKSFQKELGKNAKKVEKENAKLKYEFDRKGYKEWKQEQKLNKSSMAEFEQNNGNLVEIPLPNKEDMVVIRNAMRNWNLRHRGMQCKFFTGECKDVGNKSFDPKRYVFGVQTKDAETAYEVLNSVLKQYDKQREENIGRDPVNPRIDKAKRVAKEQPERANRGEQELGRG